MGGYNSSNLIPFSERSEEEVREMNSKGGKVCSVKKKIAARLRRLREKGLTESSAQHLVDIMEHPDLNALDIQLYLQKIKDIVAKQPKQNPGLMMKLAGKSIDLHKAHHGEKIKKLSIHTEVPDQSVDKMREAYERSQQVSEDVIDVEVNEK